MRRIQGIIKPMSITDSCQCCMSTVDITIVPVGIGNFTMALCLECKDAEYKIAPRPGAYPFKNAFVAWLDCPEHGEQLPKDVNNHRDYTRVSKKGNRYSPGYVKGKSGNKIYGLCDFELKG